MFIMFISKCFGMDLEMRFAVNRRTITSTSCSTMTTTTTTTTTTTISISTTAAAAPRKDVYWLTDIQHPDDKTINLYVIATMGNMSKL